MKNSQAPQFIAIALVYIYIYIYIYIYRERERERERETMFIGNFPKIYSLYICKLLNNAVNNQW